MKQGQFFSIEWASKALNTTTTGLLNQAAQGDLVLSIPVPPDVKVWQIKNAHFNSLGDYSIEELTNVKFLGVCAEYCRHLLTNNKWTASPRFEYGYCVDLTGEQFAYNPYVAMVNSLLCKSSAITPLKWGPTPLPTGKGDLLTLKSGQFEYIAIHKEDLGIAAVEFYRSQEALLELPPDQMKEHQNTTELMKDMNLAARRMFALACQNDGIYPEKSTVSAFIESCRSFIDWKKRQSKDNVETYADLPETAATIITPDTARTKGKQKIDTSQSYISEDFRLLIDASTAYWSKIDVKNAHAKAPTIKDVAGSLQKKGMSRKLSNRCPPLIWPVPIKKGPPITVDPSEPKKKRVRKKKEHFPEHHLHLDN